MAKYSKAAQKSVESSMKRMEKGTLRSGRSNKKVTNPKQAIAIGLSEAREKGAKVPKKKTAKKAVKKSAPKKTASSKSKKAVSKKAVAIKKAAPKKAATKKRTPSKKVTATKSSEAGKKVMKPVESFETINLNQPPVEEKSPDVKPVLPDKVEDPMLVTDKKALAKAVAKHDPKHNLQLSGPRHSIRPSGKKPLWR